tara:strand:+ start:280 stop:405 length:126 start_codon:yes stop_codon:yes gene_type:complete
MEMLYRGRLLVVQVSAGVEKVRHLRPRLRLNLPVKQRKKPV